MIIRPLTSGELSELQTIEKKGFVMKVGVGAKGKRTSVETSNTDVDINAGDFTHYQSEALYKAVAYGLSVNGEKIKPEQVQDLPTGLPEQIFNEIVRKIFRAPAFEIVGYVRFRISVIVDLQRRDARQRLIQHLLIPAILHIVQTELFQVRNNRLGVMDRKTHEIPHGRIGPAGSERDKIQNKKVRGNIWKKN